MVVTTYLSMRYVRLHDVANLAEILQLPFFFVSRMATSSPGTRQSQGPLECYNRYNPEGKALPIPLNHANSLSPLAPITAAAPCPNDEWGHRCPAMKPHGPHGNLTSGGVAAGGSLKQSGVGGNDP